MNDSIQLLCGGLDVKLVDVIFGPLYSSKLFSLFMMTKCISIFSVLLQSSYILIHYVRRPSVCDGFVFYLSRRGRAAFSAPGRAARFGLAIRECCRGWGAGQARATDWTEVGKLSPAQLV
jgi:hypothetical protein